MERVQVGFEMAANPVGADQHQGADGVQGGEPDVLDSGALGMPGGAIPGDAKIEGVIQKVMAVTAGRLPTGATRFGHDTFQVVADIVEKFLPTFVDRARVRQES